MLLGARLGPISIIVYIYLGLIGMPVLNKGGGIYYVLSPSFGYLIGFIPASYIIGKAIEYMDNKINFWQMMIAMICALFILYSLDVPYIYFISNFYLGKPIRLINAIWYGALLFVPTDLFSASISSILGVRIAQQVRAIVN